MFELLLDVLTAGVVLSLVGLIIHVWRSRNLPDRAVAADQIAIHVMAMIALHAIRRDHSAYLDLLFVFGMLGFMSSIAVARYFEATLEKRQ